MKHIFGNHIYDTKPERPLGFGIRILNTVLICAALLTVMIYFLRWLTLLVLLALFGTVAFLIIISFVINHERQNKI